MSYLFTENCSTQTDRTRIFNKSIMLLIMEVKSRRAMSRAPLVNFVVVVLLLYTSLSSKKKMNKCKRKK